MAWRYNTFRRCMLCVSAGLCLLTSMPAGAATAQFVAPDPALEQRVNTVSAELRCLVCQNQSLADSHADLAVDLKNQVREQLRAGRSEQQVLAYMTERFGDFILYRPPFKGVTLLLWGGPIILLGLGGTVLWRSLGARAGARDEEPLPPDEAARLSAMLAPSADKPDRLTVR